MKTFDEQVLSIRIAYPILMEIFRLRIDIQYLKRGDETNEWIFS